VAALVAGSVFPLADTLWGWIRSRRSDFIAGISLFFIVIGPLALRGAEPMKTVGCRVIAGLTPVGQYWPPEGRVADFAPEDRRVLRFAIAPSSFAAERGAGMERQRQRYDTFAIAAWAGQCAQPRPPRCPPPTPSDSA
jgi:hypothetical protein